MIRDSKTNYYACPNFCPKNDLNFTGTPPFLLRDAKTVTNQKDGKNKNAKEQ